MIRHADQVIDRLPRPASLADDRKAYAVTMVDEGMRPRFRPGRRLAVSPRWPVAIGDDVLVRLTGGSPAAAGETALVKELVGRTNEAVELRQHNPPLDFSVPMAQVRSIERVCGELF